METVMIEIDNDAKKIVKVSGAENIDPLTLAKVFSQLAIGCLNLMHVEEKPKIELLKPKIVFPGVR